jgi:diguanylate cyclase (GGDEF)-like protein
LLLQRFAHALQARMRRGDTLSRLGGDEFVILARDLHDPTGAQAIADDVQSVLRAIQTVDGHPVSVSASIGVYLFSTGGRGEPLDIPAIIRRAESAMYRAKTLGRNRVVFHGTEHAARMAH